ncbi:MAG: ATP-binding protein [Candidatus Thiodiazotropha taylori]
MEIIEITPEQKDKILALEEGHFADLKGKRIRPSKLTDTVSAFANASGGEVFLGIEELDPRRKIREWDGFADIEEANAHIQELTKQSPLGTHFTGTFLTCEGENGYVLQIQIFKTKDIIPSSDGSVYLRKGAQKLKVKGDEAIHQLKLDKGIHSFEDETLDIDLVEITNSEVILEFLLEVIPTAEPEVWLQKQKLINKGSATIAGALLFSEEPQAFLPKRSAVKIYRYKSKKDEGERDTLAFDPLTMEGAIYKLIYDSVDKTKELVEDIKKFGAKGFEEITYPEETLHEILTNAVLHRDYSVPVDIHIRIFDNRIEIENPGKLPGHITTENILYEQFARNPKLVRLINKFPNPPNKDVGEGLNTAFEAMRKLRLKDPEIIEKGNSVLVVIKHQTLASPEESVVEYLEENDEITNRVARELTGIKSENTMKNVFIRLHRKGLIEPVPGKSGFASAWQKKR